jgi:hypothetical protein
VPIDAAEPPVGPKERTRGRRRRFAGGLGTDGSSSFSGSWCGRAFTESPTTASDYGELAGGMALEGQILNAWFVAVHGLPTRSRCLDEYSVARCASSSNTAAEA